MAEDRKQKDDSAPAESTGTDWSKVEKVTSKKELELNADVLPAIQGQGSRGPARTSTPPNPEGAIAQYKAKRIKRGAAVRAVKLHYDAQIEIYQHQFATAVAAKKAETDLAYEKYLKDLNRNYLDYMTELGLTDTQKRQQALVRVNDQTTELLRQVQERDWPESMRQTVIKQIMELNQRFAEAVFKEFGTESED